MSIDPELLVEFKKESESLIESMLETLESIEGDSSQANKLEQYGQTVDRIMGGAKSIAVGSDPTHFIHTIGDYAALCKAVGYKASQIGDNPQFYDICVALLLDGTEMLETMIEHLDEDQKSADIRDHLSQTFLDRLRWVSNQFAADVRASVAVKENSTAPRMKQNEIDELLAKLGI